MTIAEVEIEILIEYMNLLEKGMDIVFTSDYEENQLMTSPDEIDKWMENL